MRAFFRLVNEGLGTELSNVCSIGKMIYDWPAVRSFYDEGHSVAEWILRFGFGVGTWAKAVAAGRLKVRVVDARRSSRFRGQCTYDWKQIQAFYDEGHSFVDCRERFGFSPAAWYKGVEHGWLRTRPRKWSVEMVLAKSKSRLTIKRTVLGAGVLENRCEACGLTHWRGRPISIQIDHRNGARDDHRLENLRMLCPNCHSQTETFAARNVQRKNRSRVV